MKDKFQRAWKKSRKYFLSFGILWFILTIVFVVPLSVTIVESTIEGEFNLGQFISKIGPNIMQLLGSIVKIFTSSYIGTFGSTLSKFTFLYLIIMFIGILKLAPKNEYSGIENGSSDWAEAGEQYKVLSKKKGLILAEDNYLPLDKRGNVNVLIVGRFGFW